MEFLISGINIQRWGILIIGEEKCIYAGSWKMKELIVHRKGWEENTAHIKAPGSKDQYTFNVLVRFCQFNTARVTWEVGTSLRNYHCHIGLWGCLWSALLITNKCRRAHLSVDSDMPRWMVLGYVNKLTEKIWVSTSCRPLVCLEFPALAFLGDRWWSYAEWTFSFPPCFW